MCIYNHVLFLGTYDPQMFPRRYVLYLGVLMPWTTAQSSHFVWTYPTRVSCPMDMSRAWPIDTSLSSLRSNTGVHVSVHACGCAAWHASVCVCA